MSDPPPLPGGGGCFLGCVREEEVRWGGALELEAAVLESCMKRFVFPLSLSLVVAYWLMPPVKAKAEESEGGE